MEGWIEKRIGALEERMSELAAELEMKENFDRERASDLQIQSARTGELNSNFASKSHAAQSSQYPVCFRLLSINQTVQKSRSGTAWQYTIAEKSSLNNSHNYIPL